MGNFIKVNLDGREYQVGSENVETLHQSVDTVNNLINNLRKQTGENNREKLFTLASLNLAETNIVLQNESNTEFDKLISELNSLQSEINARLT